MPLTLTLPSLLTPAALAPWLLDATALWVVVGLLSSALSAMRGESARARRGIVTILLVSAAYLATLLGVSLWQPARILAPGQSRCFAEVCFSVLATRELPGFQARDQTRERLVRVTIGVHNTETSRAIGEPNLRASLVDDRAHRWAIVPGLSGVSLSTRVQPGGTTTSDPVFRVPGEASGLHLELLHAGWYPGRFIIGDPESLLHRSTQLQLPARMQLPAQTQLPRQTRLPGEKLLPPSGEMLPGGANSPQ